MAEKTMMYRFYELRDEIKKAIENSKVVEEQQKKLIELVVKSPYSAEFKDFIQATTNEWKEYENQRAKLNTRLKAVETLISIHEKQDEEAAKLNELLPFIFEALGVAFRSDKKPN